MSSKLFKKNEISRFHIYLDSYIAIYKLKFEYELYVRSIQYCVISKLIDGHYWPLTINSMYSHAHGP